MDRYLIATFTSYSRDNLLDLEEAKILYGATRYANFKERKECMIGSDGQGIVFPEDSRGYYLFTGVLYEDGEKVAWSLAL